MIPSLIPSPIYELFFSLIPLLRTILVVPDTFLPFSYSIPSPVISVVTIIVIEVPGTHFTLRFPL
jgi:hypothetical protein